MHYVSMAQLSLELTQHQLDEFARLSGDDNPIHVDPEFAAGTRFGRTVAHGMHLFSLMDAGIARHIDPEFMVTSQSLMFSAPTFTDEPLTLRLDAVGDGTIDEELTDSEGNTTAHGSAVAALFEEPSDPEPGAAPAPYKGLEVGMSAIQVREFTPADVAAYTELVEDPRSRYHGPAPEIPRPLLGGLVSRLLGVDLPGPGTNWLKQRYWFHRQVTAPAEVTMTVAITRLRPEKSLVDLAAHGTVGGEVVVSGRTLVLAADVAPR